MEGYKPTCGVTIRVTSPSKMFIIEQDSQPIVRDLTQLTHVNSSQVQRIFLGFDQPPLITAAEWLFEQNTVDRSVGMAADLSDLIVVVPSIRAKIRLNQLLVQIAGVNDVMLTPPVITTIGDLPEYLYTADKSLATDLAQQIAWSKALEATPDDEIRCLVGRTEIENLNDWQPLAIALSKLHRRLANDIWSFRSVAREVGNIQSFLKQEAERWNALKEIQRRYYALLTEVDLWDKQAARNYAAAGLIKDEPEIRCHCDKRIVLLGTADLNRSVSEMLRQVTQQAPDQVTALIAAPESLADRFNEFGSLITEEWLNVPIRLKDSQIQIVDQAADQAFAAAHYITSLEEEYSVDEITIGVPDPVVVPQIERSLNAIGVKHRHLAGRPLAETGPVRMMIACREYLRAENYETFAALVRHPDMFNWLSQKSGSNSWIQILDHFQNNYLPGRIGLSDSQVFGDPQKRRQDFDPNDPTSKKRAERNAGEIEILNNVHGLISSLLKPLTGGVAPITKWTRPWSDVLSLVYGDRLMDRSNPQDRQVIKACRAVYEALGSQQQIPTGFGTETSAIQALDWAIEAASETRVIPPAIPDAIELAGWLDLPLDDAPVMVITGMNDEHVPTSEIGHQFLPNALCETLGILDNNRRFARDAYALTVVTSVRENLLLVAGRRDEVGEPKKPSRLLFTEDAESSARRAKAFFSYTGKPDSRFWLSNANDAPSEQQFYIPFATCSKPPTSLTVTSFKEYLRCPYRFYLQKILRLRTLVDDWRELSGGTFGDLAHDVLEAFGRSDARDETRPGHIQDFLSHQLDITVAKKFPDSRLPAVRIQLEQLRRRLRQLSEHQAIRRREGWRIVSTEELLEHELIVDDQPFIIRGKIDRVDQHEGTGRVAVWDYKTSDKGELPGPAHRGRTEWKDLQLPLYRHLVKEVEAVRGADFSNIQMGYVMLPKKLEEVGFQLARWNAEEIEQADRAAIDIIRKIRRGCFWPPNPKPPQYSEDFAAICQDNVFEQFAVEVSE